MVNKVIQLCYARISTDTELNISATQLRSYIGYKFIADTEFHHHDEKPYRYPLIQYKRVKDRLFVMGIGEYADLVFDRLSGLQHIVLSKTQIPIRDIVFERDTHQITDQITQYRFTSPWIALNAQNYTKFRSLDRQFKKRFLENILIGNLLSMLKGLNIRLDYELYIQIKWYKELPVTAHEHGFSGFYAKFATNLSVPEHIGIGKSVSKGFGMLERIDDN